MRTSLVISTYNRPDALQITLESALLQIVLPSEIIIADDGSGIETSNLIKKYQSKHPSLIKHVWHEDNGFRLAAIRNKAMITASTDYIIQIDGDIMLHPSFIKDHIDIAQRGFYVAGSRAMLTEDITKKIIDSGKATMPTLTTKGVGNRLNSIRLAPLMKLISMPSISSMSSKTIKGCHMAFWKSDFLKVNGYNEDFVGWGSEDVELELRFKNLGLRRKNLKFGAIQYHLYHPENDRERTIINEQLVEKTRRKKLISCDNGASKYHNK